MRGCGIGWLKGAKEMHSARLSATASVNRESYFYMPNQKRSFTQPAAFPPCLSHFESMSLCLFLLSIHEARMKFKLAPYSVTMLILHRKRGEESC